MAFDQDGRLYVADIGSSVVHRYDSTGQYLDNPAVSNSTTLLSPVGMIFESNGRLLISSRDTNAIDQSNSSVVVTLSGASTTPISVAYATADGNALAGKDYTAQTGTITFAPGQTSQQIPVGILPDLAPITNDTFNIQLSNPSGGATIANGTAVVTIVQPVWPQVTVSEHLGD